MTVVVNAVRKARVEIIATDHFNERTLPALYASALEKKVAVGVRCHRVAFIAKKLTEQGKHILAKYPGSTRTLFDSTKEQRLILIDRKQLFWSNDNPAFPLEFETNDPAIIAAAQHYFNALWKKGRPLRFRL